MSKKDNRTVSILLHSIGDFERISDHAVNLVESAEEMYNKNMKFSEGAAAEIHTFTEALRDIIDRTIRSFTEDDFALAATVEPLEEAIDDINEKIKRNHIERLKRGECTIELGFVLSDISNNYERVADHCSNLAVCQLEAKREEFDPHAYLNTVKSTDEQFLKEYQDFSAKYHL